MKRHKRTLAAALAIGVVLGLSVPAAGHVSESISHNWNRHYKALAQRLFFTKAQSDGRYARTGAAYKKSESDGLYAGTGDAYTKTESDDRYPGSRDFGSAYCRLVSDSPASYPAGPCATIDASSAFDPAAPFGSYVDVAVGTDGLPVGAAYNSSALAVELIRCLDAACMGTATTTYDPGDDIGFSSMSVVVGFDGIPVVATYNLTDGAVELIRCTSLTCAAATSITYDTGGDIGGALSMALGADGIPVVAASNETNDTVEIIRCTTPACAAATSINFDPGDNLGVVSLAVGDDGIPVVAARNVTESAVEFIRCTTAACTAATSFTFDPGDSLGFSVAITVGNDGVPVVAAKNTSDVAIELIRCTSAACTDATSFTFDPGNSLGFRVAIAVGTDGRPVVAARNETNLAVELIRCATAACTAATSSTFDPGGDLGGISMSIDVGTDGIPIVAANNVSTSGFEFIRAVSLTN